MVVQFMFSEFMFMLHAILAVLLRLSFSFTYKALPAPPEMSLLQARASCSVREAEKPTRVNMFD